MFRKLFVLLFVIGASGCSKDIIVSDKPDEPYCAPAQSFVPEMAKVTLGGAMIFSNKNLEYYFDLPSDRWSCEIPNSPVVNTFKDINAQTLNLVLKKQNNKLQDILEIRLEFDGKQDFRDFVSSQCASQGLSYLFEVSGTADQKIYGCQINPRVKSAIMWKRTSRKKFIDLAYLPLYQPFVDRLTELN